MEEPKAKQIADYIFENVFGKNNPYSLEELVKKFALDVPKPKRVKCLLSGSDTWTFSGREEKIASQEAIIKRFQEDEWMRKKEGFQSVADILRAWDKINYLTGEKYINSKDVSQSDSVFNSASVYQSASIFDSRNIIFSYKVFDSLYLLACRDDSSCELGIRMKESIYCSASFEVSWSAKVSRGMFIHDCFDLYECLFCSHIRSKKYCIANMQFDKEEYFRLKKLVINWVSGRSTP